MLLLLILPNTDFLNLFLDSGDIMLASASQDYFIRIWRFSQRTVEDNVVNSVKELSVDEEIKMRENTFQFKIGG
jgi:hypothetical protein